MNKSQFSSPRNAKCFVKFYRFCFCNLAESVFTGSQRNHSGTCFHGPNNDSDYEFFPSENQPN